MESDAHSTSSSSSSPAIDRSSNVAHVIKAIPAQAETPKPAIPAHAATPAHVAIPAHAETPKPARDSLENTAKNLFPSLEPIESQQVEEEFDKITSESKLDSLLSKEPSTLDDILEKAETEKRAPKALPEVEPDEFQDEIQFDPTISSGQLGFGDFRNTPIKLGESRSESVQPILENLDDCLTENAGPPPAIPAHAPTTTNAAIEPMTPTEAEILLSSKLEEKRSAVLSDEQAQEVNTFRTYENLYRC